MRYGFFNSLLGESDFYVANAATLLAHDSAIPLYVAVVLAQRLDGANQALVELKRQLRAGEPSSVISNTVQKVEQLLSPSGNAEMPYSRLIGIQSKSTSAATRSLALPPQPRSMLH